MNNIPNPAPAKFPPAVPNIAHLSEGEWQVLVERACEQLATVLCDDDEALRRFNEDCPAVAELATRARRRRVAEQENERRHRQAAEAERLRRLTPVHRDDPPPSWAVAR